VAVIAPARRAAFAALVAIQRGRSDLDTALDRARDAVQDPRDVALVREIVTGTLRWQARLDWVLAPLSRVAWEKLDPEVQVVLRMAAYQLTLDRLPAAAVVHDAVALVRQARKSSAAGLVNAVLRRLAAGERRPLPDAGPDAAPEDAAGALAVRESHPAWLVERWLHRETRDDVDAWLAFDNTPPPVTLRANPLRAASREAVAAALAADGVRTTVCRWAPLGLVVVDGPVMQAAAVRDGRCHVQDEGSQLAALVAPVTAGQRVLDLCAAPGGKALAYAAAIGDDGRLVACDVRPRRVATLRDTLVRGGAARTSVVAVDPEAPLPFTTAFAVVAVDAPCSGLGTLRRDPDIKWRRSPADLAWFRARQTDLLARAAEVVAPGGVLVYTTCSTEPEENADVVAALLAQRPDFTRRPITEGPWGAALSPFVSADGDFVTHPVRHALEGYFGAVLARSARGRASAAVVQ
jgi:16S rRNA (cytosine967-C5)-methyltransferase